MRLLMLTLCLSLTTPVFAASQKEIFDNNARAVVYLEVRDSYGNVNETGSGFVVSHDGHIVTVAHIKTDPSKQLWAVIGQRSGTAFPLTLRERDESNDVALWQLPQSPVCRQSVVISSKPVAALDPVLSLGFPGRSGLTTNSLTINNLQTDRGFYKTDGFLEPGNSGGPVFNQAGQVVAIVQGGGLPGTENNEIVPIALAINLIRKRNVTASIDTASPYNESCYSPCRHPEHGIASWTKEQPWSESSGWMGGGNNPRSVCGGIASSIKTRNKADDVEIKNTGESSKKDVFGHLEYQYHCSGVMRFGPIYAEKRSPSCGLWN
ncbi:serine protease [Azospirillum sp. TSO5]|uniref:S1 family peptidase n=1 Tax=Azospirillum sp. TSO5 TaxID=716760 RepID=UPI000D646ADC|nr:serine protease [Azospirillum sp. TSO5]